MISLEHDMPDHSLELLVQENNDKKTFDFMIGRLDDIPTFFLRFSLKDTTLPTFQEITSRQTLVNAVTDPKFTFVFVRSIPILDRDPLLFNNIKNVLNGFQLPNYNYFYMCIPYYVKMHKRLTSKALQCEISKVPLYLPSQEVQSKVVGKFFSFARLFLISDLTWKTSMTLSTKQWWKCWVTLVLRNWDGDDDSFQLKVRKELESKGIEVPSRFGSPN